MVPLYVTVVIARWGIRRIKVCDVEVGLIDFKYVTTDRPARPVTVENNPIVLRDTLSEMLTDGEAQVTTAIVVSEAGNREDSPWLFTSRRKYES